MPFSSYRQELLGRIPCSYWGYLLWGLGLSVLQTAVNPYVTILGEKERAAQRFSIMGICNKLAGIIEPILFAAIILKPEDREFFESIDSLTSSQKDLPLNWKTGGRLKTNSFLSETNKQLGMILACRAMPIGTSMNKDKL